jgi:hypothetical protein
MNSISDLHRRKRIFTAARRTAHSRNRAPLDDRYLGHLDARGLMTRGMTAALSLVLLSADCLRSLLGGTP